MLTGLLWFSIGYSLKVENKLLKLRYGVFCMRCEMRLKKWVSIGQCSNR